MWNSAIIYITNIICTAICLFLIRIFIVYLRIHNTKKIIPRCKSHRIKMMVILGSGGHTFEMIRLMKNVGEKFCPRIYVVGDTDQMSENKVITFENSLNARSDELIEESYIIEKVQRCREVGQSWTSSFITTCLAFIPSLVLVLKHKPEVIICNGPGTCVPICVSSVLLQILGVKHITIIYVESICRVETLSLSGKLLYHLVDQFLVQWPQLQKKYPRSKYIGLLV